MAINFPNSPSVNDQHTAAGVTWTWDGTTWKADGVTSSYVLPTAAANTLGGIKVGTGLAINSGTLSATASAITVQEEGTSLNVAATTLNFVGGNVTATGTGATKTITITGATNGLQARKTTAVTTSSIANAASDNITFAGVGKSYGLLKIQVDKGAWVVLYTSQAARTADSARLETTDPLPGSGVIAEILSTAGVVQGITPGTIGWNDEATPTTDVYAKVTNKSGSTGTVAVTLTTVQLEA
tara:strand:- start:3057 stop:3779 length:723 start_codon:yes stop_codon:yes gene_type:complete